MFSSQQFVIKWVEYAAAGAILLLIAKLAVSRLRQPADRINLILTSFVVAAVIPLLVFLPNAPVWHLGLVAPVKSESVATTSVSSRPYVLTDSNATIEEDLELHRDMIQAPAR
jgi:hypothetical protein